MAGLQKKSDFLCKKCSLNICVHDFLRMQVIHEQSSLDFVNDHNSDLQINQVGGLSLKKVNPQIRCLQFRSENVGDIYIGEEIES